MAAAAQSSSSRGSLARFAADVVSWAREASADLALLHDEAVPGSLYSGASGVAFFFLEAARLTEEDRLLEPARQWLAAAQEWAAHAARSDWGRCPDGFILGESGLAYVEALFFARLGDRRRVLAAARRVESAFASLRAQGAERPNELMGGVAGLALAARGLEAGLQGRDHEEALQILRGVREDATAVSLSVHAQMLDRGLERDLGAAHGVAGELWSLVETLGAKHAIVQQRLRDLRDLSEMDEEGFVFWSPRASAGSVSMLLPTWCNGITGHAVLWCEVAKQVGDAASLALARASAETTWLLRTSNPGMCCGAAGQSLVLRRYGELTGDGRSLKRSDGLLARAARTAIDGPLRFHLWQGALGVALLAMRRLDGDGSFPFFEIRCDS